MLKSLTIKNYALIENIEWNPDKGLNIVTGETGSGKSILLDALGLILGERTDVKVLRNPEEKCIVEGHFEIENYNLNSFFDQNDIDFQNHTILRREINQKGVSRAFINDTPVNITQLKELGIQLIDLHSQHQNLSLNDANYQLEIIDKVAGNEKLLKEYQNLFGEYQVSKKELFQLQELEKKAKADLDYFQFQLNELEEAKFENIDLTALEEETNLLSNAEQIKANVSTVSEMLNYGERNISASLKETVASLKKFSSQSKVLSELTERLNSTAIEVKDIATELESYNETIQYDPKKIELLNEKLNTLYALLKKHNCQNIEQLKEVKASFEEKVSCIDTIDIKIEALQKLVERQTEKLNKISFQLSQIRKKHSPLLEQKTKTILKELSMQNALMQIEWLSTNGFTSTGMDQVRFLFSANKGSQLQEFKKVASGGEIARVMLAVKAVVSESTTMPTIIFDEIDTGVSGEVASKMGEIMKKMSKKIQVLTNTHLPQIAVKGNVHFKVSKSVSGNKTTSEIKLLNEKERVLEIAQMLSGHATTQTSIANAQELLSMN
jgi:DNA repair protein RecN (Recombination protein N)